MNCPEPTRDQIAQAFETIRLKLINYLKEPERSAFWLAVEMRDVLSRPHEVIETPCHRCEDYAEECAALRAREEQLNLLVTDRYALRARVAELEAALKEARPFIEEARDSFGNEDAEPATAMLSRIDALTRKNEE
jgi:hypothetical protein